MKPETDFRLVLDDFYEGRAKLPALVKALQGILPTPKTPKLTVHGYTLRAETRYPGEGPLMVPTYDSVTSAVPFAFDEVPEMGTSVRVEALTWRQFDLRGLRAVGRRSANPHVWLAGPSRAGVLYVHTDFEGGVDVLELGAAVRENYPPR